MIPRLLLLLLFIGGLYFIIKKSKGDPYFIKCGKCDGKGYWIAMRGEKDTCDNCNGSGKIPR